MIRHEPRPPVTRRRFTNGWAELEYLCKKIHYWLYTRGQSARARRYLHRLERVLHDLTRKQGAILREEALALLHELKGDVDRSIAHRRREIQLMERLHQEAQLPHYTDSTREYMLRDRDTTVLAERRAILEALEDRRARQTDDRTRNAQ
jgi:hypothetical protein